jgi:hypothetical protein
MLYFKAYDGGIKWLNKIPSKEMHIYILATVFSILFLTYYLFSYLLALKYYLSLFFFFNTIFS